MSKIYLSLCLLVCLNSYASAQLFYPDTDFGVEGAVYFDPDQAFTFPNHLLPFSDGSSLLTGVSNDSYNGNLMLMRLDDSGNFIPEFGNNGIFFGTLTDVSEGGQKTILGPSGEYLIGGSSNVYYIESTPNIWRMDENPNYDLSFGDNGAAQNLETFGGILTDLALSPDQSTIYKGGYTFDGYFGTAPFLAAYDIDGQPKLDFGEGGLALFPDENFILASGFILVANDGLIYYISEKFRPDFSGSVISVYRFNPDGTLDSTYGDQGERTLLNSITTNYAGPRSGVIDEQGRILICGGYSDQDYFQRQFVTRLDPNGLEDITFGNNGVFQQEMSNTNYMLEILDFEDKIVVIGSINYPLDITITVLDESGIPSLDNGPNGIYISDEFNIAQIRGAQKVVGNKIQLIGYYNPIGSYDSKPLTIRFSSDIVSSTKQVINQDEISIYPNPVRDAFNLVISGDNNLADLEISLFSIDGKRILNYPIVPYSSTLNLYLPNQIPTGTYFLIGKNKEVVFQKKITVIH